MLKKALTFGDFITRAILRTAQANMQQGYIRAVRAGLTREGNPAASNTV